MSASELELPPGAGMYQIDHRFKPKPLGSLVASAQRITSANVKARRGFGKPEAWQEDAWDMYDLVGEQRFLATTLAGRLAQAKLYVGKVKDDPIEPPEPIDADDHIAAQAFAYFGDSPMARAQMIMRLGINLFVAGDGWLVGIPRNLLPHAEGKEEDEETDIDGDPMLSLDDLEWRMLSISEVSQQSGEVTLKLGDGPGEQIVTEADDIFLIRVWRPHPRRWWQADSPTRSSLPVLRELVGLTMHISAQIDSRLAGAGVFIVPESARRAIAVASGLDPDDAVDPFTEALIEAMLAPISDRANASALVPLVITVPDESTALFQHITFSSPLDSEARSLRDESIRRLALGQDAPPELLLGVAGMNHWGAWLVREDVVTTHIEPPLALICDAITTQFLWPVLIESGMDEDEAHEYVVWYDVSHMVQRPNRLQDAQALYEKGVISDETLRESGGFAETDAPDDSNRSIEMAIQMAQDNPALVDNLKEIIAAFDEVLNPTAKEAAEVATTDAPDEGEDITAPEGTPGEGEDAPDSTEQPSTEAPSNLSVRQIIEAFEQAEMGPEFIEGYVKQTFTPGAWGMVETLATIQKRSVLDVVKTLFGDQTEEPPPVEAVESEPEGEGESDTSTSVAVVALPADPDLPGEEEKHATIAYYGKIGEHVDEEAKERLMTDIGRIATATIPFVAPVVAVDQLGDEGANVWVLDAPTLTALYDVISTEPNYIKATEAGVERYPEYLPHVTIGYDDSGGELGEDVMGPALDVTNISFDRLALWWGDERIEFPMGGVDA